MCIRRISKKDLSYIFGFYSKQSGRYYAHRLRIEVFTDLVLDELKISSEEYRGVRIFNPAQTTRIVSYFNITEDDLNKSIRHVG